MRFFRTLLLVALLFGCSVPSQPDEISHMKKSRAITHIIENMEELSYDDSYSEIDRGRLNLSHAKDFYREVFSLNTLLKKQSSTLPNGAAVPEHMQADYKSIITLFDKNLHYLKKVIDTKSEDLVFQAVQETQKSCTRCHSYFKN
jgi:cytochrome c556